MKNIINIKSLFLLFIKLIIFLICMCIIWKIFTLIRPNIANFFSNPVDENHTLVKCITSVILGLLDIIISAKASSYFESIYTEKQELPRLFLFSPPGRIQNVSGIKAIHSCNSHLCVKIGNKQPKFRIVYARIQNTGKSSISECSINGQMINITLLPDQSSELYFIIYESDNCKQLNSNIRIPYCIWDDQGNTYVGKYCIKINYSRSVATFQTLKKMKRSILKNALSNL